MLTRRMRTGFPISLSQAAVLGRLDREGPSTASALALAEHIRPQSMAPAIHELAADGLVVRSANPSDRRQVLVELTRSGRAALEAERRRREGWLAQTIATSLNADERRTLAKAVALLERLSEAEGKN